MILLGSQGWKQLLHFFFTIFFKLNLESSAQFPDVPRVPSCLWDPQANSTQPTQLYSLDPLARLSLDSPFLQVSPRLWKLPTAQSPPSPLLLQYVNPIDLEPASVLLSPHPQSSRRRRLPWGDRSPRNYKVALSSLIKIFVTSHWYGTN